MSARNHGFDFARITSRSHGTSGPDAGNSNHPKNKGPNKRGPGHIHNGIAVGSTGSGRELVKDGDNAYVLNKLGSRHSDSAMEFLHGHVDGSKSDKPFFLYYPANSNHGPYTPDKEIAGKPVAGAARTKSGKPMDARHDFIYENDVALGRMMKWLSKTNDPRRPGNKLVDNTLVIFTSDNGAEIKSKVATGPFRSNKGSAYEGGHRVAFIASWPEGGVGDGDETSAGQTNSSLIALQDMFATFAAVIDASPPDLHNNVVGGEDSRNILTALKGEEITRDEPLFHSDHNQAKDRAACAMRLDIGENGKGLPKGKWKLLFDADLVRFGKGNPTELFNLATDQREKTNLINQPEYKELVAHLVSQALLHRNIGGHRFLQQFDVAPKSVMFDFLKEGDRTDQISKGEITLKVGCSTGSPTSGPLGLGIGGVEVANGESITLEFDRDVIIESIVIRAGRHGSCGGSVRIDGREDPLQIYCSDADNDAQDQHAAMSDIGYVAARASIELSSQPFLGVEQPGKWRVHSIRVRKAKARTK